MDLNGAPKVVGDSLREIEILGTIVQDMRFEAKRRRSYERRLRIVRMSLMNLKGFYVD